MLIPLAVLAAAAPASAQSRPLPTWSLELPAGSAGNLSLPSLLPPGALPCRPGTAEPWNFLPEIRRETAGQSLDAVQRQAREALAASPRPAKLGAEDAAGLGKKLESALTRRWDVSPADAPVPLYAGRPALEKAYRGVQRQYLRLRRPLSERQSSALRGALDSLTHDADSESLKGGPRIELDGLALALSRLLEPLERRFSDRTPNELPLSAMAKDLRTYVDQHIDEDLSSSDGKAAAGAAKSAPGLREALRTLHAALKRLADPLGARGRRGLEARLILLGDHVRSLPKAWLRMLRGVSFALAQYLDVSEPARRAAVRLHGLLSKTSHLGSRGSVMRKLLERLRAVPGVASIAVHEAGVATVSFENEAMFREARARHDLPSELGGWRVEYDADPVRPLTFPARPDPMKP